MNLIARFSGYGAKQAALDFVTRNRDGHVIFVKDDCINVREDRHPKPVHSFFDGQRWVAGTYHVLQESP